MVPPWRMRPLPSSDPKDEAESGPTPIDGERSFHRARRAVPRRRTSQTTPSPLVLVTAVVSALLVLSASPSSLLVAAQETDGSGGAAAAAAPASGGGTCTQPAPTCAGTYYKISDETNGLATSCAAVDQTADPVVGLDQNGCQAACDGLEGCDTINFRWVDPNFGGQSTCYRKNCGSFQTAACTLFSKHKERDVYTKACGADELWSDHVLGGSFDGLFAGVLCPDESAQEVSEVLGRCTESAGVAVEPDAEEVSFPNGVACFVCAVCDAWCCCHVCSLMDDEAELHLSSPSCMS